jgi:hypothetical protein
MVKKIRKGDRVLENPRVGGRVGVVVEVVEVRVSLVSEISRIQVEWNTGRKTWLSMRTLERRFRVETR